MTNGILLLDKPLGMSSNSAVQRVRRAFGRVKAGHTGNLDPLATGMLPVCPGEATKVAGYLLDGDKEYEFTMRFGVRTATGDLEGAGVFSDGTTHIVLEPLEARLAALVPPPRMHMTRFHGVFAPSLDCPKRAVARSIG